MVGAVRKAKINKLVVGDFLSLSNNDKLAEVLSRQIDTENFARKYAPAKDILLLVGAGAFLAASVALPNLPRALKPFLDKNRKDEYEAYKRFNIPYLKRTLKRLEGQKLVEVSDEKCQQVLKITQSGRKKVLRYALDSLAIKKPKSWNGEWYLVSYDIPEDLKAKREVFNDYLKAWGFYPLHHSAYLHAYPCGEQIEFLREYLRVGGFVRILTVSRIENDNIFREFFGV